MNSNADAPTNAPMMTDHVRVEITFMGLCLFVPDSLNGIWHVLLPVVNTPMPAHKHEARARFEHDYLVSNSSGADLMNPALNSTTDWTDLAPKSATKLSVPDALRNIGTEHTGVANRIPLKPESLQDDLTATLPRLIQAHFKLPGSVSPVPFNVGNSTWGEIAACVAITMNDVPSSKLPLMLDGQYQLRAVAGRVQVTIGNLVAGNWMHPPQDSVDGTSHFHHFYPLLSGGRSKEEPEPLGSSGTGGSKHIFGLSPYTCTSGSGCGPSGC